MSSPSYFTNARDFHIQTFNVTSVAPTNGDNAFEYLHSNIAIDAVHNSEERYDAPKCHAKTRKAVQEEILGWIMHGEGDPEHMKILWLTGPAGAGKTAIAGSIADTCHELGILAGSFFFASFIGSERRRSKRYLVATLVYHLILPLDGRHPLRRAVLSAIQQDPSIFRRQLREQVRVLLIKPFSDTRHQFDATSLPSAFVVDGLDEVEAAGSPRTERSSHEARLESEKDQEEILSALLYATRDRNFPFRFVIASRPERTIQAFFSDDAAQLTREIFLDEKYDPDSDIALFLNAKFSEIRKRYRLPLSWPPAEDIERIVDAASGQFIYAATILRFLQKTRHNQGPQALLRTILDWQSQDGMTSALAPLDALYTRILMSSPDPPLAIKWISAIDWSTPSAPAFFVNQVLQEFEGQGVFLLESLSSLIKIPLPEDESSPYKVYHKSLSDFLTRRAGGEIQHGAINVDEFIRERGFVVLRDKSPQVRISDPDRDDFLCHFLRGPWSQLAWYMAGHFSQDELSKWDVAWWVHRVIKVMDGDLGPEPIYAWFESIHKPCIQVSTIPGNCLPSCNHWRSNIIRTCKALGWDTPNEIALLREVMWYARDLDYDSDDSDDGRAEFYYHLQPYFKARSGGSGSTPHLLVVDEVTTRYTPDEDYQTSLNLVAAMFARLPRRWRSQYDDEVRGRVENALLTHNALSSIIKEIRTEMGIEVKDLVLTVNEATRELEVRVE